MAWDSGKTFGYGYVFLAALLWSLTAPLSKACLLEGITPLETAFWRAALGGLCFAAQGALRHRLRVPVRHACIFMLFGIAGVGLLFGSLQISIQESGGAMAMILMFTAPVWVAIFSRFLFNEVISRQAALGILIAFTGSVLVCLSGGSLPAQYSGPGIFCGLLAGISYAIHFPFFVCWKNLYATEVIYAYMLVGGLLSLLPAVDFQTSYSASAWIYILLLGVLTNYGGYYFYGQSLRLVNQVPAAVLGNLEPVLATIWVWLFWNESFTLTGWVGSFLILAAVLCITLDRR